MGILEIFEPEELIGKFWAKRISGQTSYRHYQENAVKFDDISQALKIYFRALGGDAGLELSAAIAKSKSHRLSFKMKIAMDEEKLEDTSIDDENLILPSKIDFFDDRTLNRKLYFWLAAFMININSVNKNTPISGYLGDLHIIRNNLIATNIVFKKFRGLKSSYKILARKIALARPKRNLPEEEALIEEILLAILTDKTPDSIKAQKLLLNILDGNLNNIKEPIGYKSFLQIPLWGYVKKINITRNGYDDKDIDDLNDDQAISQDLRDGRKRKASQNDDDQGERDDPLILNRFEKIITIAEMVNVNSAVDDDENTDAKAAADDLDEISLSKNKRKTASKIKFDLDLPPDAVDETKLIGKITYPEWDYRKSCYHPDHCMVFSSHIDDKNTNIDVKIDDDTDEIWIADKNAQQRIRRISKQFEALRPKRQTVHRQLDGQELDIDALIRSRCDFRAMGEGSDQIFTSFRNQERDMATAILADTSLSTDGWIDNRRILDVEKEALMTLTHGLNASDDQHAIYSFSSKKRTYVKVDCIKKFDEKLSPAVIKRIGALKAGYYTRMGAAIRHVSNELQQQPNIHKLLLIISDGKPNDLDHYEGRYGIEDTRKAIIEARANGLAVFGVTIDIKAQDYFPYIFGRGGCAIVPHIDNLSSALPGIFRQLIR